MRSLPVLACVLAAAAAHGATADQQQLGGTLGPPPPEQAEPSASSKPKPKRGPPRSFRPVALRGTLLAADPSGSGVKSPESPLAQPDISSRRPARYTAQPATNERSLDIRGGRPALDPKLAMDLHEGRGVFQGEADKLPPPNPKK